MIESESFSNQQIIVELFDNKEIEFIKNNGNVWITSSAVAKGLEIDRRNVNQIYQNNNALLNPYSCVIKLMIHEKDRNVQREVRIFDKTGFIGICMRSNSSKAVPFQKWALNAIDEILNTGQYIEKKENIYEELYPETKKGISQAIGMHKKLGHDVTDTDSPTFIEDTSQKIGVSDFTG